MWLVLEMHLVLLNMKYDARPNSLTSLLLSVVRIIAQLEVNYLLQNLMTYLGEWNLRHRHAFHNHRELRTSDAVHTLPYALNENELR